MPTLPDDLTLHQMKNTLANLQAYVHLALEERAAGRGTCADGLDLLQKADDLGAVLADQFSAVLRAMTSPDGGGRDLVLHFRPADVTTVARRVVAAYQGQAARKRLTLVLTTLAEHRALVDARRLEEAVDNLVSNAVKFSPPGASVWVSVRADAERTVCIDVQDEGPGLTAADRAHLFERRARRSARPTGGESSSGLGLSIAHHIVQLHGGELTAQSLGPERGSVFRIRLPLSRRRAGAARRHKAAS